MVSVVVCVFGAAEGWWLCIVFIFCFFLLLFFCEPNGMHIIGSKGFMLFVTFRRTVSVSRDTRVRFSSQGQLAAGERAPQNEDIVKL